MAEEKPIRTTQERIRKCVAEWNERSSKWPLERKVGYVREQLSKQGKPQSFQNIWSGLHTIFPEVRELVTVHDLQKLLESTEKKKPTAAETPPPPPVVVVKKPLKKSKPKTKPKPEG